MTDTKNKTVWITIPEETNTVSKDRQTRAVSPTLASRLKHKASAWKSNWKSKKSIQKIQNTDPEKVENKAFWGAGFVALIAFVVLLFAPHQMANLMQGNLFDGTFKVVPDFDPQKAPLSVTDKGSADQNTSVAAGSNTPPSSATPPASSGSATPPGSTPPATPVTPPPVTSASDQNVVKPVSDAVSIQVDPLPVDTVTPPSSDQSATSPAQVALNGAAGTEPSGDTVVTPPVAQAPATLDASAQMIQSLSKQIDDFKSQQQENQKMIQQLTDLVQAQASGTLHGAAGDQAVVAPPTGQQASVDGIPSNPNPPVAVTGGSGTYRYNTHTATLNPHDVLAKNQSIQSQQGAYQANIAYGSSQAYSKKNYNTKLAGVHGNAATGPAESLMLAMLVASFGILVWGSIRAARA